MRFVSSLALVGVLGLPVFALAQPSSGTVFISAGGFAAIEKSPTATVLAPQPDTSGTVAGGGLGIGVHLTERVTARVEWSLTDTLTQSGDTINYPYYYPPELLAASSGASSVWVASPQLTALTVPYVPETRRSTAAGFALLGYHLPAGRASIELLGGVGLLNEDVEGRYDVRIANAPAGLSLPALPSYRSSSYHAVAVVGADVAVSLASRAAIVPQVRVYAHQGGLSVRPGLALRWTF